jgi:hypothetical protein
MSEEKIKGQILNLDAANENLRGKIAINENRMRALVGKLAGVKTGDVVLSKGVRYHVLEIVSKTAPAKGKPVLSGLKIAKNGNLAKRPVEIKGAWSVEGDPGYVNAAAKEIVRLSPRRGKPAKKPGPVPVKRRGRPSKKALEDVAALGHA